MPTFPSVADRISALANSGEGFSPEAIAAMVLLDHEIVLRVLQDPSYVPPEPPNGTLITAINFRGDWDPTIIYEQGDVVYFDGSSYVARGEIIGAPANPSPEADTTNWHIAVRKGADGAPGADGVAGPTGVEGPPGPQGPVGVGTPGPAGATGPAGPQGPTGTPGATGQTGGVGPAGATGPAGVAGPQGPQGIQGLPGVNWAGVWSTTGTYNVNDAVYYSGGSYRLTSANPSGQSPDIDTGHWALIALPGATGPAGAAGPQGISGPSGPAGATGPAGAAGPAGPQGLRGPQGVAWRGVWSSGTGYTAYDVVWYGGNAYIAKAAVQSVTTPDNDAANWDLFASGGPAGATGPAGAKGDPGVAGPQGPTGTTGATGATGQQGPAGPIGTTGATGAQGPAGATGPAGTTGAIGPAGPTGAAGAQGPAGAPGINWRGVWATNTIYAANDAVFYAGSSYRATQAVQSNVTPDGDAGHWALISQKGDTGSAGPAGSTGAAGPAGLAWRGTWSSGTTYNPSDVAFHNGSSYLMTGTQALLSTTSPPNDSAHWALFAQAGATGAQGATGATGVQGPAGATGAQGATGPQGAQGATGPAGPVGMTWRGNWQGSATYAQNDVAYYNGSSYICISAVQSATAPPSDATHWQVVTLQGATGATGSTGSTGSAGPTGPAGLTWQGNWNGATTYAVNDAVYYNGSSYRSLTAHQNVSPPSGDTTNWALIAQQGAAGAPSPGFSSDNVHVRTNLTAAQTIGSTGATGTALSWSGVDINNGALWASGQPTRLTAPVAGTYLIEASVQWNGAGGGARIAYFGVNGAGFGTEASVNAGPNSGGGSEQALSMVKYLAAGDYVETFVMQTSGGNLNVIPTNDGSTHMTMTLLGGPAPVGVQPGVVGGGDLAISGISVNGASGAITFTLAAAAPAWVKNASGVLVPVNVPGQTVTIAPGTLPTSGNRIVIAIFLKSDGTFTTSASAQAGGASAVTPTTMAVTGAIKVLDVGLYNNAGTYQFSNQGAAAQGTNWFDRRPWARGAHAWTFDAGTGTIAVPANTWTEIPGLATRLELGNNNMVRIMHAITVPSGAQVLVGLGVDGAAIGSYEMPGVAPLRQDFATAGGLPVQFSGGSHIFRVGVYSTAAITLPATQRHTTFEEHVFAIANNGTA